MQPSKLVTTEVTKKVTETKTEVVAIEKTKFFDFSKIEPGQPGVYEVNTLALTKHFDHDLQVSPPARFSYWLGRSFGPVRSSPFIAEAGRLEKSTLGHTITHFRGYAEQPLPLPASPRPPAFAEMIVDIETMFAADSDFLYRSRR